MRDSHIQQFVSYITQRGVPQRFHELYRNEATVILSQAGLSSLDQLDQSQLNNAVAEAERRLQNRKAVCAALEAFLSHLTQPTEAGTDASPDSMVGSVAVQAVGGQQHRRFVRVPFNREIEVVGSLGGNRCSDLSVGGLYLETRSAWRVGDVVQLKVRLRAEDEQMLELTARVAYADPGMGVGLDFIELSRQARHAIRQYVEQMVTQRAYASV